MASSVNAKLLAACRGFIRFGSGLVSPAVTLAACARRANRLLPPNEGCESRRSAAGTVPAFSLSAPDQRSKYRGEIGSEPQN